MKPSKLSLQLWQAALDHLNRDDIPNFLNLTEQLRLEVFTQCGRESTHNGLEVYYQKIYNQKKITTANLTTFISLERYRVYYRIASHILFKGMIEIDRIYVDGISLEESVRLLKCRKAANALTFFFPAKPQVSISHEDILEPERALINKFINEQPDPELHPSVIDQVNIELFQVAERLRIKYEKSWFKWLQKNILIKRNLVNELRGDI